MLCDHSLEMLGGSSFKLATILGIRIGVHASWFLVLFLVIVWLRGSFADVLDDESLAFAAAVATAVLFFGSILLHELGHALAARRVGIEVAGIDLFFFGGLMKMSRDTDTPGKEFFVAVAGPLVTLGIVVVGALAGIALAGPDGFWNAARLDGSAPADVIAAARVLPGLDQHRPARLQPRAGLPARRRPDRARRRLEADRRPRSRHALLGGGSARPSPSG